MKELKVVIKNQAGLHARPAALVVGQASKFKCSLMAQKGEKKANLKSLLDLLSLGICQSDEITIKAEGVDENEALDKITSLITGLDN